MTFIISAAGAALLGVLIWILIRIHKKKKDRALVIKTIKEDFPELLTEKKMEQSATDLVKSFMFYFTYDPKVPSKEQTSFNRQQRRRIKRHWKKFLLQWWEIPEEVRDIEAIVEYLAGNKWETRVVERYVKDLGSAIVVKRKLEGGKV